MGDKNGDNFCAFEQQPNGGSDELVDLDGGHPAGSIGGHLAESWTRSSWMGTSTNNLAENTAELKVVQAENTELRMRCMESENKLLKKDQEEFKMKLAKQEEFNVALVNKVEELTKAMAKLSSEKESMGMELAILRQQHQAQGDGHSAALVKKVEQRVRKHEDKLIHLLAHHWERIGACLVNIAGNCWNGTEGNVGLALSFPDYLVATCQAEKGYINVRSKLAFSDEFCSAESEHCRRLFYAEFLIQKKLGTVYIGLSAPGFAINSNKICGQSDGSFAVCSDGSIWTNGVKEDDGAVVSGGFVENEVVGIGLLTSPHDQGRQLVITKNGQSIGKLYVLHSATELFPTVSLQGYGTTVEAKFDSQRLFAYDWMVADLCALGLRMEKKQQPTPNAWGKRNADVTVHGLTVTKSRAALTYGNVMAKFAHDSFYFEGLVKEKKGYICIGVSDTEYMTANGVNNYVGEISGSWSICSNGSCYTSGTGLSGHFPGGFGTNDTVGCGVCSSPGTGVRLFFATKNGAIHGIPIVLPGNASEKLFPTISLAGSGTSVKVNFGNDPNKPFLHSQLMKMIG